MIYSTEVLQKAVTYLREDTGRHFDDWGLEWPELGDRSVISTALCLADHLQEIVARPDNYGKPPIFRISTRSEFGDTRIHTPEQTEESSRCATDVISSVGIVANLPIRRVQSSLQEIAEGRSPYMIEVDLRKPTIDNP